MTLIELLNIRHAKGSMASGLLVNMHKHCLINHVEQLVNIKWIKTNNLVRHMNESI